MQIAIVGTGAIGSTFAYHLAKAGHTVTVVARGKRLEQLRSEKAIVKVEGDRAPVTVCDALDPVTPYDLVLVTVLATQVEAVMPALKASPAKTVMFMFNTFEPLTLLRDAVGVSRFAFGFPSVVATLPDGRLKSKVFASNPVQVTTVTDAAWAKVFTDAGIATKVQDDMQSWLRSHAASTAPMMALACVAQVRGRGVSWHEARGFARGWSEAFRIVRQLENTVTPRAAAVMGRLPGLCVASMMWILSRQKALRELGAAGPGEARMLIDSMTQAAPGKTTALLAIRP